MKRWLILLVVFVVCIGVIVVLSINGVFDNLEWETALIIIAAITGPFKLFHNSLSSNDDEAEKKQTILELEKANNKELERGKQIKTDIKKNRELAANIEKDIELMSANLEILEKKQKIITTK